MCYLCFSSSSVCKLVDIDEETQTQLENISLRLVEVSKVPPKFCETCGKDIILLLTFLNRIKSANRFWHKFAINIGIIKPSTTAKPTEIENTDRNWECKQCDYKTTNKDNLFKHVWIAHTVNTDDPATCRICNKKLASEYYNRKHFLITHYEGISEEHAICSECGFLAKTSKHLTSHMKHTHGIVSDANPFHCEWCLQKFSTQARLDVHTEKLHPEKFWAAQVETTALEEKVFDEDSTQMDMDDRNSPYEDDDDLPLRVKPDPEPATNEEPKKENSAQESSNLLVEYKPEKKSVGRKSKPEKKSEWRKRPRTNKQDDITQKCPDCEVEISGKVTMAVGGLRRHYWVRHGRLTETPNVCRGCNKSYNNEHLCRVHYFSHHFDASFFCDICGKTGMTKSQLNVHKTERHIKKEGKTFMACRFCNRKYDNIEKLQEHEKEHEQDGKVRPHVCNECGKCYMSEQTLQRHIKTHMGKH